MASSNRSDQSNDPIRRQAHAWVRRLVSGEATVSDAEALKRWCETSPEHASAFADAQRLWHDFEAAGQRLQQRRETSAARPLAGGGWSRRAFIGGALTATAAAVVAAVHPPLAGWPSAAEWGADYRTATGEQKRVDIADGVSLELNTQTSIALQDPAKGAQGIRLIAGEAAIDSVARLAQPFVVLAGEGRASTRGSTRFEVRHEGERVCVTCLAGEVEVTHGAQRRILGGSRRIFYGENGFEAPLAIDPGQASAWRRGVVVFRRTPLTEAIAEINRYRPGHVMLLDRALGANVVSGRFDIRDMDRVIAQIQVAFGMRVTTLPGDVVLLS